MSVTIDFKCDACAAPMGASATFTFRYPTRLQTPLGHDVHACSERCAAKTLREAAAKMDERARWQEEHEAALIAAKRGAP